MKRALAERAKQSGLPNGVAPATPATVKPLPTGSLSSATSESQTAAANSSSSSTKAPLKIERNEGNSSSSAISPRSPRNPSSSPRPKKRMRESVVKLEEEDEEDSNASAFYLRHQNRALASELRSLKYALSRLERERDYRRSQCTQAVQSLNALQATWTQMEAALQCGQPPPPPSDAVAGAPATSSSAPVSTGSGMSVELIGALLDSLATLGATTANKKRRRIKGDDDGEDASSAEEAESQFGDDFMDVDVAEKQHLDDLLRITDNIAKRAATLQRWIWSLLQRVQGSPDAPALDLSDESQQQVITLMAKNKSLKAKLKEISRSRDEMCESEKRVRRGLYRLAAGRVQLKEVLKAIATSDEDKEAAAAWMEAPPQIAPLTTASSSASLVKSAIAEKSESGTDDGAAIGGLQNAEVHKQIADLEQVASARDEQIKQLLAEREDQVKRINSLVLNDDSGTNGVLPDHEVQKSELYTQMTVKLASSDRKAEEAAEKMLKMKAEWSAALADAELSRTSMEEMHAKHLKRWAELSAENGESGESEASMKKADEFITVQHKLTQALESVRQAETTKQTLNEALTMNESLQGKLEEVRSKYSALQAGRSSSTNSSTNHNASSSGSGVTTPKPKASSSSSGSAEKPERHEKDSSEKSKLHREYRRVRKELAAATASKEAAKAKLERTEKERDSLNQTNSRLLRQAAEKDEMNAKSLSTILHLKQLTEQITKEKENLEQQVKSSQQVALAARLATNARERVTEEFEKERKALEGKVSEWEQKCADLTNEKEMLEGKIAQENAKMAALMTDAEKARSRCEELVSESTKLQEEKQKMMESLAVAQREAAEATTVTERLAKQSGGGALPSGFTAEQLSTQVSVLKSRLACPVCNHRDKKCILLRCRHMFCKQCVDENIKNRSRKCPACGGRFDTKDVADVWL